MIIKNYKKLAKTKIREKALKIIESGLEAVKTEKIIKEKVKLSKNILIVKDYNNKIHKFNLARHKKIIVIGFGKSSAKMGKGIEKILGGRIDNGLIISTKKEKLKRIEVLKGTHPLPSLKNIKATKRLVKLIENLDKDDLVVCLISGGGSSLLCYPNISFAKYLKIIKKNYKAGLEIQKFNQLRKKLSRVKAGKLAGFTKANIISLIFSDVVGDDLKVIASGPTAGSSSKAKNILLLNNKIALEVMKQKALSLGLKPMILTNKLKGEARIVGRNIIKETRQKSFRHLGGRGNCFLFGGETTVRVIKKGKGGRNLEFCLGAIKEIAKFKKAVLVSFNTDGIDGPTDAAGAVVAQNSLAQASKRDLDYKKCLENNASYYFFKKLDDLIFTGPTGINIADLGLIINLSC